MSGWKNKCLPQGLRALQQEDVQLVWTLLSDCPHPLYMSSVLTPNLLILVLLKPFPIPSVSRRLAAFPVWDIDHGFWLNLRSNHLWCILVFNRFARFLKIGLLPVWWRARLLRKHLPNVGSNKKSYPLEKHDSLKLNMNTALHVVLRSAGKVHFCKVKVMFFLFCPKSSIANNNVSLSAL